MSDCFDPNSWVLDYSKLDFSSSYGPEVDNCTRNEIIKKFPSCGEFTTQGINNYNDFNSWYNDILNSCVNSKSHTENSITGYSDDSNTNEWLWLLLAINFYNNSKCITFYSGLTYLTHGQVLEGGSVLYVRS